MSGGWLVVLDRLGRDVKRFPLPEGLATLGSDPACDIRVMLPSVSAHHATVVVHANQTVVRNVSDGETLVNERSVSVAALRHGDVIGVGGRSLRWDYAEPARATRHLPPEPPLSLPRRAARGGGRGRRATGGAPLAALARSPALRHKLEMSHRASMPGSAGGKQVAIVQPQRRDTTHHIDKNPPRAPLQANKRRTKNEVDTSTTESESDSSKRRAGSRTSPKNVLQTTKATLWIESRKTSPRRAARVQAPTQAHVASARRSLPAAAAARSTPLRLTVLRKAQSVRKMKITKIEAPLKIDHTKQAAIMLMTGHTPKARLASPKKGKTRPSYVVKRSVGGRPRRPSRSRASIAATLDASAGPCDTAVTILDNNESATNTTARRSSRRSGQKSPKKSPKLPSPKKSALKDPSAKKSMRKSESIKFDLSNLEDRSHSVQMVTDTTERTYDGESASEDELSLRYTDSSSVASPSPRRSIHSRSGRILEKSLGTTVTLSRSSRTLTPESPRSRKSSRGSLMLQKALDKSDALTSSRRSTKSSERSGNSTAATAYQTRTLSPRSPRQNLESYSIVDLVSIDSNESNGSPSVYNSVGSMSTAFGTPQNSLGRKTRSTLNPALLGSSTPYVKDLRSSNRSQSSLNTFNASSNVSRLTTRSSKSLSTPENTEDTKKQITVNSTKISRATKSRSRLNDSDLLLVEGEGNDDSPKSSKRRRKSNQTSPLNNATYVNSFAGNDGTITPENTYSAEEATTPVLSIQSLLDSSQSSFASYTSQKGRPLITKRKTIGGISEPKTRAGAKSKSMSFTARKTRLRLSSDSVEMDHNNHAGEEVATPKSAVKLVPEGVKNKHSTAKKPQSKRSIIDDLNESDIVKQLFNSPVKRKLSQSMTEYCRKQLFEDDDDIVQVRRATRNTVAVCGNIRDRSLLEHSEAFTPERFVSPLSTPSNSPSLSGIKRLFRKSTPVDDLSNVRGVKALLRTPRTRKSIKNDFSNVSGVKTLFGKSPVNRLSVVRIKDVFAASPKNDLRRVTGVKSLFQTQKKVKSPKNDLRDVRGVKKLFRGRKSPSNDLRDVSGVKRTMRRYSPENDLTDVRGVKRMFRNDKGDGPNNGLDDISGVEELFNASDQSHKYTDSVFDRLLGRPPIRAVYSKTFSTRGAPKSKRSRKSLHASLDLITNNVGDWLEQELHKRLHKTPEVSASELAKNSLTRELQKLATDTVDGHTPICNSRVRNSTLTRSTQADAPERMKSASEIYSARKLPIKKRSLVEKSVDKTKNDSKVLPIKKRAVIHSTPVKGRVNMTMNASELGRVSPIAVVDKTTTVEHDTMIRINQQPTEPKERSGRRTKALNNEQVPTTSKVLQVTRPSPKKTRGKFKGVSSPAKQPSAAKSRSTRRAKAAVTSNTISVSAQETKLLSSSFQKPNQDKAISSTKSPSPAKTRATRSRKTTATPETKLRRRGAAVVVSKKTPLMSPKRRATRRQKEVASPKITPKKTKANRKIDEDIPKTPKTRATRKKLDDKPKTPKNTRAKVQRASVVVSKPSPQLKPRAEKVKANAPEPKRSRRAANLSKQRPQESRETRNTSASDVTKTRSKRTALVKQVSTESEVNTKRGRRTKAVETTAADKSIQEVKRTRGKKIEKQASVQSEPTTRSRRTKPQVTETKTRKRKSASEEAVPKKVAKSKDVAESKSRKRVVEAETAKGRQKRSAAKETSPDLPRRGAGLARNPALQRPTLQQTNTHTEQKRTRGKKAANVTVEIAPVATRKRKIAVDPSPVKDGRKKQPDGKKSRKTAAAARSRSATAVAAIEPAGRSRRR